MSVVRKIRIILYYINLGLGFRKYFHKAICQSGTATMDWVMQVAPMEKTIKLALSTGCKEASTDKILGMCLKKAIFILDNFEVCKKNCEITEIFLFLAHLMDVSASDLYNQTNLIMTPDEKRRGLPMPLKPVVEKDAVIPNRNKSSQGTHTYMNFLAFSQTRF